MLLRYSSVAKELLLIYRCLAINQSIIRKSPQGARVHSKQTDWWDVPKEYQHLCTPLRDTGLRPQWLCPGFFLILVALTAMVIAVSVTIPFAHAQLSPLKQQVVEPRPPQKNSPEANVSGERRTRVGRGERKWNLKEVEREWREPAREWGGANRVRRLRVSVATLSTTVGILFCTEMACGYLAIRSRSTGPTLSRPQTLHI